MSNFNGGGMNVRNVDFGKKINKVILKFKRKLSNLKTYFLNENQVMEPSGGPASQLEATLVRPENVC